MLLSISSVVHADWKFITQIDGEAKFYIDTTTITIINGNKRAWLKTEYIKKLGGEASSSRAYIEFDCKEKKSRRLSFEAFKDSNLVNSIDFDKKIGDWIYSPPKSISEGLMTFVCKLK